jgi:hypothetical protein
MLFRESPETEAIITETLSVERNKRKQIEATSTPQLATRVGQIQKNYPGLPGGVKLAMAKAGFSDEQIEKIYPQATVATTKQVMQPKPKKSWFERNIEDKLKTASRYTFAALNYPLDITQTAFAQITDSDDGVAGWNISTDLGSLIANDTEAGNGWFMGGKARELQAERARRVRGTVGGHAWTIGRGLASVVSKPDTMAFNIMSGALDAAVAVAIPVAPGAKGIKKTAEVLEQAGRGGIVAKGIVEGTERIGRASTTINRSKVGIDEIEAARYNILVGNQIDFKAANRWFGTSSARRLIERTAETNNFADVWDLWGRKITPELANNLAKESDPNLIKLMLVDKLGQAEGLVSTKNLRGGNKTYVSLARRDKWINKIPLGDKVSRAYANMPQHNFNLMQAESPRDQVRHLDTIDRMMKLALVDRETQKTLLSRAGQLIVEKNPVKVQKFVEDFDEVIRQSSTGAKVISEKVIKAKELIDPRNASNKVFKAGQRVKTQSGEVGRVKSVSKTGEVTLDIVSERVHGDLVDAVFDSHKKFIEDSRDFSVDDLGQPEDFGFFNKVNNVTDPTANDITFANAGLVSELARQDYFIPDVRQIRRLTASKPINWVVAKQGNLADPNIQRLAEAGQLRLPFSAIYSLQEEIWRPLVTATMGNHFRNTLDSQMSIALSHRKVSSIIRHPFEYLSLLRGDLKVADIFGRNFDAPVTANQLSEAQEAYKFATTTAISTRYKDPVQKWRAMERLGVFRTRTRGLDNLADVVRGHGDELGKLNSNWATRMLAGGSTTDDLFDLIKAGDEDATKWFKEMSDYYSEGRDTYNRTTKQWAGKAKVNLNDDNNLRLLLDEQSQRLLKATGDGDLELLDIVASKGGLATAEKTVSIKSITRGEVKVGERVEYRTASGRIAIGEVSALGTKADEVLIRPYAFIEGEMTPDLRRILESDRVYKNPKMPQKVVEEIRNPNTPQAKGLLNSMNRIVDSFHGYLYNQPIGKLERSPIFKELYYDWVDKLADSLDQDSVRRIMADIRDRAASEPGGAIKPQRITGDKVWQKLLDIESGKRKAYGTISAEELSAFASGRAIDDMQKMFYNAVDRRNGVDAMRLISPFAAQWGEFIGRASRVAFTPTNLGPIKYLPDVNVMRKSQLMVEGVTQADPDGNGRGMVYKDPATGQMLFTIPLSGAITKFLTGVESPINARVKGVAMGFEYQPGLGPMATIAASKLLPDKPSTDFVRSFLLPFGPRTDLQQAIVPGWAQKVIDGMTGNEGNAMFMNVYTETMQALAASGDYDPSDDDDRERLLNDAKKKARVLFALRGLSQFTGPASGTYDQVIKVAIEKGEIDVYASQLSSVFREMQENDYDTAVPEFIRIFGEDAFVYMGNKTKSLYGGLDASTEFGKFERENKSLFRQHKETAGYFGPIGSEFDFTVYTRQLESGKRVALKPEETLAAAETTVGVAFYRAMRANFPKSMNSEQREYMSQYRDALKERFKGYADMKFDPNKLPRQLDDLFTAAKKPALDGNPVAEGVRYYEKLREQVLVEAANRGYSTLAGNDVEDLRVYLAEYAEAITAKYPQFARVYDRLLSQEVED